MIAIGERLNRRARRKIIVLLSAGAMGLAVPLWVPRLLATIPAFQVREVTVVGTRYLPPDQIKHLAEIAPDASVWDDPDVWADRVRGHPLVQEASVRREGFQALEIAIVEKRPVALVATPELRPVSGEGRLLPLEPAQTGLDLPILAGVAEIEDDMIVDPGLRELAGLLDRMDRAHAEFVSLVSEVGFAGDGGYRFAMLPGAEADEVLLPPDEPIRALERVSIALGQVDDPRVKRADARFASQVVLTRAEGR